MEMRHSLLSRVGGAAADIRSDRIRERNEHRQLVTDGSALLRLPRMLYICILMHMRTTLNIDDSLLERAAKLTGTTEKTSLVRQGLEALISLESAKRLAALGGSEKQLRPVPRRRPPTA